MGDRIVIRKSPDVNRLKRQHDEIVKLTTERDFFASENSRNEKMIAYFIFAQLIEMIGLIILVYLN